jgi:Ca2+-transporting ATPase
MAAGPRRRLFSVPLGAALAATGVVVGLASLGAYLAGRSLGGGVAQTMAFATVALAELVLVFSCRSVLQPAWRQAWNPHLGAGVAASVLLLGVFVYLPALHEPFGTTALGSLELGIVLALAVVPAALAELTKAVVRRRDGRRVSFDGSP